MGAGQIMPRAGAVLVDESGAHDGQVVIEIGQESTIALPRRAQVAAL
jgi:hypothetical protein